MGQVKAVIRGPTHRGREGFHRNRTDYEIRIDPIQHNSSSLLA